MMRSVLYLDVANWAGGVKCQNSYVLVHVKEGSCASMIAKTIFLR